jgi:hypothetical protein
MKTASIHVRIAYANDERWASMYALNKMPPNVRALFEQSKRLGLETLGSVQTETISGEKAMELVRPKVTLI